MNSSDLINKFESAAELVEYAITGLTIEQYRQRVGPGTWSIGELIIHLLDADLVGGDRIKRVIAEDQPTLFRFDETRWVERLGGNKLSPTDAAQLLIQHRRFVSTMLRLRTEDDFRRAGTHSERGRLTLAELIRSNISHIDHHLKFLYAKRGNLGLSMIPRYSYSED